MRYTSCRLGCYCCSRKASPPHRSARVRCRQLLQLPFPLQVTPLCEVLRPKIARHGHAVRCGRRMRLCIQTADSAAVVAPRRPCLHVGGLGMLSAIAIAVLSSLGHAGRPHCWSAVACDLSFLNHRRRCAMGWPPHRPARAPRPATGTPARCAPAASASRRSPGSTIRAAERECNTTCRRCTTTPWLSISANGREFVTKSCNEADGRACRHCQCDRPAQMAREAAKSGMHVVGLHSPMALQDGQSWRPRDPWDDTFGLQKVRLSMVMLHGQAVERKRAMWH